MRGKGRGAASVRENITVGALTHIYRLIRQGSLDSENTQTTRDISFEVKPEENFRYDFRSWQWEERGRAVPIWVHHQFSLKCWVMAAAGV